MAQNSKYSYSEDDLMQPVYCIVCRQHIPKDISNAGKGICPQCVEIAKAVAAATATTQAQSNMQTENETKMDCDQSTDTIEVELESQNDATEVKFYKIDWFIIAGVALTALIYIGSMYQAEKNDLNNKYNLKLLTGCANTVEIPGGQKKENHFNINLAGATESPQAFILY